MKQHHEVRRQTQNRREPVAQGLGQRRCSADANHRTNSSCADISGCTVATDPTLAPRPVSPSRTCWSASRLSHILLRTSARRVADARRLTQRRGSPWTAARAARACRKAASANRNAAASPSGMTRIMARADPRVGWLRTGSPNRADSATDRRPWDPAAVPARFAASRASTTSARSSAIAGTSPRRPPPRTPDSAVNGVRPAASLEEPVLTAPGRTTLTRTRYPSTRPEGCPRTVEAGLGRRVHRLARDPGTPATDETKHTAPRSSCDHARQQCVGELDRGEQIDLDERPDLVRRHLRQRPGPADTGVVDQEVDASERVHRLRREPVVGLPPRPGRRPTQYRRLLGDSRVRCGSRPCTSTWAPSARISSPRRDRSRPKPR